VFLDYRPLNARLSGLASVAGDIRSLPFVDSTVTSLSCLHVIEHIGLGRYGDDLDPKGSSKAARELQRILASRGKLYLSVPVGRERVCFNAHRVFSTSTILAWFPALQLTNFSLVGDDGKFLGDISPTAADRMEYGCGMFEFTRP
jgi:SAM-dependent methyltransferase